MRVQNPGVAPATGASRRQNEVQRNACEKDPDPSVKDKKPYRGLRDDGNSRLQSARIANAAAASSRKKVSKKGGRSAAHVDWSKTDLLARAKQVGIKGRSGMSKSELVKALRHH